MRPSAIKPVVAIDNSQQLQQLLLFISDANASGQHTSQTLCFDVNQSRRTDPAHSRQIINRTKRSLCAQIDDLLGSIRPNVDDLLQLIEAGTVDVHTMSRWWSRWRLACGGGQWLRRIGWRRRRVG
jgi:hypothetical protein